MVVGDIEVGTDVLVIGAGPAGYTAAIRLGQADVDVTLAGPEIGGICLHHGCIPVKALEHTLSLAADLKAAETRGIRTGGVTVDLPGLQAWKKGVIQRLEAGVNGMLKASGVQVFDGTCQFTSSTTASVRSHGGTTHLNFKRAIIATGAHYSIPEGLSPDGKRIVFPYSVARLEAVPASALVLGGGVAGATMASLLARLGSKVSIAFKGQKLIGAVDDDVLQPALKKLAAGGVLLLPGASWSISADRSTVTVRSAEATHTLSPDLIVVCPRLKPTVESLALDRTKVKLTEKGFVAVGADYRTADPGIYAIGDVLGGRRNAAVAFRDGLSVADILTGKPGLPAFQAMPLTVDAGLKIACAGLGETEARQKGLEVVVSRSPYSANGGAATAAKPEGLAKVIAEKATGRILGAQIVGERAEDLLGEAMLALEMGARLEDVALTLHPHPEIVETFLDACARGAGLSTNAFRSNTVHNKS